MIRTALCVYLYSRRIGMTEDRGRFYWYDLMTTDVDGAKSFYTKLIGWGTTLWEGGDQPYTMWTTKDQPIGGVMTLPEEARKAGAPPHWLSHVLVPKVDETLEQAKKLGGSVMVPGTDVPTVGRFGVLQDPQGGMIAVFAADKVEPESPPHVGTFSWNELATSDPEAAWSFYESLFGWEKADAMDMGEMGTYQMYKKKGGQWPLGGIFKRPAEMPATAWLYYAMVKDVHESVETVKKLGGKVLNGPMEVPGGDFIAQCMDPQGAAFALHSTKT
jgi:predicted enzyme related to lactoylglutathione lyase